MVIGAGDASYFVTWLTPKCQAGKTWAEYIVQLIARYRFAPAGELVLDDEGLVLLERQRENPTATHSGDTLSMNCRERPASTERLIPTHPGSADIAHPARAQNCAPNVRRITSACGRRSVRRSS